MVQKEVNLAVSGSNLDMASLNGKTRVDSNLAPRAMVSGKALS